MMIAEEGNIDSDYSTGIFAAFYVQLLVDAVDGLLCFILLLYLSEIAHNDPPSTSPISISFTHFYI